MLDLAFIRDHADLVRRTIREKGDHADLDKVLALDADRRKALVEFESLRSEQNRVSKEIAARKKRKPEKVLYEAVRRMLPKNKLAFQMIRKLKIYAGSRHPHQAQQPEPKELGVK